MSVLLAAPRPCLGASEGREPFGAVDAAGCEHHDDQHPEVSAVFTVDAEVQFGRCAVAGVRVAEVSEGRRRGKALQAVLPGWGGGPGGCRGGRS
ncbi:MAG: hypothetical protein R3F29_03475 [Planctomycetota bacterium]